jgi:cytochrome c oxidase subunit 4
MAEPSKENHDDSDHGDHGGLGKYFVVFAALCVLTSGSFLTYSDWWAANFNDQVGWAFMMAVSCTKAMLVILFFMHLKWEANWKYVLTFPAGMMSMFLVLMLVPDVGLRMRHYSEEREEHRARTLEEQHAESEEDHSHTDDKAASHKH